jgi:hypothetical protein
MPDGRIVMAQGPKIYIWDPSLDGDWQELVDFESAGIHGITRLAVSPAGDMLALVAAR